MRVTLLVLVGLAAAAVLLSGSGVDAKASCPTIANCTDCTSETGCGWCQSSGVCASVGNGISGCPIGDYPLEGSCGGTAVTGTVFDSIAGDVGGVTMGYLGIVAIVLTLIIWRCVRFGLKATGKQDPDASKGYIQMRRAEYLAHLGKKVDEQAGADLIPLDESGREASEFSRGGAARYSTHAPSGSSMPQSVSSDPTSSSSNSTGSDKPAADYS